MDKAIEQRFWAKVSKSDSCWTWTGARNSRGYGNFKAGSRWFKAHRTSYELLVGPIPDGLVLDHLCRNPPCVNPAHLEPVTSAENLRRAAQAITHCPQNHPYDEANTRIVKGDYRQCRECDRDRKRAARGGWQGKVYGAITHCPQNHEYTPENTRLYKGLKRCRTCQRELMRRRRAAARLA